MYEKLNYQEDSWDPINQFNSSICLCLSIATNCISNFSFLMFGELGEMWLFNLFVLVELLTITIYTFFSYLS